MKLIARGNSVFFHSLFFSIFFYFKSDLQILYTYNEYEREY